MFDISMDTHANRAHFWTGIVGLVAAIVTLLAAIGGSAGVFQGGGTAAGGQGPATGASAAAATPTPSPARTTASQSGTPAPSPAIWRQGTLEIPIHGDNQGQAADFDAGKLVLVETPEEAREADLGVREDGGDVLLEPGIVDSGDSRFYARFVAINDEAMGRDGCATGGGGSVSTSHLRLFTDVEVGSHVCLMTSRGRTAEFEIMAAKLNGKQRWIELQYSTWAN